MPALALHVAERVGEVRGLVPVEARRRLVEQQQLRLGHQRAPDLDEPAAAEAERLDRAVGDVVEAEQLDIVSAASMLVGVGPRRG